MPVKGELLADTIGGYATQEATRAARGMNRRTIISGISRRAVLAGLGGSLLSGCAMSGGGGGDTQPSLVQTQTALPTGSTLSGAPVKVALLLPFGKGGEAANIATALKQAAELALFDVSSANIALIPKDTLGTAQGAAAAAQAAIGEGAELILGPLYASEVLAVAPVARQSGVPVIAFSSDRKVAGNGVYLLSFLAGDEIARVVSYAAASGKRSFAGIVPQTAYGSIVESSFRSAAARASVKVATVEHYAVDASAVAEPVNRLKAGFAAAQKAGAPIDALLVPGGQDVLPIVAPMLPQAAMDGGQVKILGSGGWNYASIGNEAALVGGWFAGPDPAAWTEFSAKYAKTYGNQPVRLASLSYDAVTLALALAAAPPGQRFTPAMLTRPSGFAGVDGLFRLRPDGACERGLAILEVSKFGPQVIDPAPSAFGAA